MKKFSFILISSITIFFLSSFLFSKESNDAFGHIITFLAIIIGFCITALSIVATSNFAKDLYKQEDPKDNSKTLLHNLTDLFKSSIIISSITIVLILVFFYIGKLDFYSFGFCSTCISIKTIIVGSIWYLTIVSILQFIRLILLFSKFVIQSVKRQ